jgi:hypothetical protein
MVQKPKAPAYYAPYLLHHSSATVFEGFRALPDGAVFEVQKQRLLQLAFPPRHGYSLGHAPPLHSVVGQA